MTEQPADKLPDLMAGSLRGDSIESHADTLGQLYELEFTQVGPGPHGMHVDFLASSSSVVYRERYPAATYALGSLKGGKFGFALPVCEPGSRWWGQEREGSWAPTTLSGELIDASFAAGHLHLVAVIEQSRLVEALEQAGFSRRLIRQLEPGRRSPLVEFAHEELLRWTGEFGALLDSAIADPSRVTPRQLEDTVLAAAMSLLDRRQAGSVRASRGSELFRRALEVHEGMGHYPSIAGLCEALHARPRTLESAFRQCAGIPPHRFFQLQRLNRARRTLAASRSGESSVTRIATGLGFSELGRFAGQYRRLFGELPSETLRRKPRAAVSIPF